MITLKALRHSCRSWLIFFWAMSSTLTHAVENDVIRTELLEQFTFTSKIDAIETMRAICLAKSRRDNTEHVGAVLQSGDAYFTVTHGEAKPGQKSVRFSIQHPSSLKIVALWHTHGAIGRRTHRFSIADGETVRRTGLPFYLIDPRGRITLLEVAEYGQATALAQFSKQPERKLIRAYRGLALYRFESDFTNRDRGYLPIQVTQTWH